MSHNQHTTSPVAQTGISGNLVAAVLILNLIIIGLVLLGKTMPPRPEPSEGLSVAYIQNQAAQSRPTATPLATDVPTAAPRPRAFVPDPQRVRAGEGIFQSVCSACHGLNAQGVSGLGPSLVGNVFIADLSNQEFLAFLIVGRQSSDPANVSGVTMPARGGNPSLTDNDLTNVINYVRSLNPTTVVYDVRPDDAGGAEPVATVVVGTPTPMVTVAAIEFKPLDLSGLGGSSATETPTSAPIEATPAPTLDAAAPTSEPLPTVAAIEFKPLDLSGLGGSSPTATPAP